MADPNTELTGTQSQTDPNLQPIETQTPPITPAEGVSQAQTQTGSIDPGLASAAQTQTQAAAAGMSVRDFLRGQGLDLSHLQDDHAALSHLTLAYRQAQEAQRWAPYAQQYAQHQEAFQNYLRQQQAQMQQPQAAQSWWKAPEFDPAWRHQMQRNSVTGQLEPIPGAPADIVDKYHAAVQHQQKFLDKFAFDPMGAIKPGIEEVAQQIAMQVVQQHLGQFQQRSQAEQLINQNADWLYQKDQGGNFVYGPSYQRTGKPELSQTGRMYANHVAALEQGGVRDQTALHQYAYAMTERDVLLARQSQGTAQNQQQQANQQFLAAHNRPNVGGSLPNGTQAHNPNGTPSQNGRLSLEERLRQTFAQRGITDATIQAELK